MNVPGETSILSSNGQDDVLLDLFIKSSESHGNQENLISDNVYAIPLVKLPYLHVPNQPFSQFDFNKLDSETAYDKRLHNRSISYFGEVSYSYNNITHTPKPIPASDTYLNQMLDHLSLVLPDFNYNSILITKYLDGSDNLPFHSDNESEIVENSDIVTISLGETRTVKFRGKSLSDNYPEQSLIVKHGDVFVMSRDSQNFFEHSLIADSSQVPRISLTLRLLKSSTPEIAFITNPIQDYTEIASPTTTKKFTLYIGDSMLKNIKHNKMSSNTQDALVYSYPGATVSGVLSKLKADPAFLNVNPNNVDKVFLFCGANNIDKVLNIPFSQNSNFADPNAFIPVDRNIEASKSEITELITFIHTWSEGASINFVNILPRVSFVRNQIINYLNSHIKHLSDILPYLSLVSTELHRNLFTFKSGYRKDMFFSSNGTDNVHLNELGIVRLAKHLKYFAHNN